MPYHKASRNNQIRARKENAKRKITSQDKNENLRQQKLANAQFNKAPININGQEVKPAINIKFATVCALNAMLVNSISHNANVIPHRALRSKTCTQNLVLFWLFYASKGNLIQPAYGLSSSNSTNDSHAQNHITTISDSYSTPFQDTHVAQLENQFSNFKVFSKPIRVCFNNAPSYGDQALTQTVMTSLRKMGFNNTFEVIYANNEKTSLLFGLPSPLPDNYRDKTSNTNFINLPYHEAKMKAGEVKKVNLGFSVYQSGRDNYCYPDTINTRSFIHFSPYTVDLNGANTVIMIGNDQKDDVVVPNSNQQFYRMEVATLRDVRKYLETDTFGKALAKKQPGLTTYINHMENGRFNILSVYARTMRFNSLNSPAKDRVLPSFTPSNILMTIAGARYAQLQSAEGIKPLVITVFGEFDTYAKQLQELIVNSHWHEFELEGADKVRAILKDLKVPECFSTTQIDDPKLDTFLSTLSHNQIVLLTTGPLPRIVMNGLYHHQGPNMWPKVLEGASTINEAINVGKPFFRCGDHVSAHRKTNSSWQLDTSMITDETLKQELKNFYHIISGYCGGASDQKMPNLMAHNYLQWSTNNNHQLLGQFILKALSNSSSFSHYFTMLKNQAQNNDRVTSAIIEAEACLKKMARK